MNSLFIINIISFFLVQIPCDQVQGYYSHNFDKDMNVSLYLYPNNVYTFKWTRNEISDVIMEGFISSGKWTYNNKKIILTDSMHGFQTICDYSCVYSFGYPNRNIKTITIEQSFRWINGFKLTKYMDMDDHDVPDMNDILFHSDYQPLLALKEREQAQKEKNMNEFFYGEYIANGYQLLIQPDHSYKLSVRFPETDKSNKLTFKNLQISDGKWERKGNVLILFDVSVKCKSYLLITTGGLKSNQMIYSIEDTFKYYP